MIIKRAITRYVTYFLGVSTTAFSIFLINYFLDSNEFAVWGVTNSLIYILAQLGQLTYVQYVEKYFPNLSASAKKKTLYMFIKTTFVFFPLWFFILIMLYFLNYFSKFNISNIGYLFLMITISVVIEASIEIVSKYLLTTKDTIQLDKNEFIYSKLLRLLVFTLLLLNGFSIYHLLFTNILLRAFLFLRIINLEKEPFDKIFKNILKTHIWDNNFTKSQNIIFSTSGNIRPVKMNHFSVRIPILEVPKTRRSQNDKFVTVGVPKAETNANLILFGF